MTPLNVNLQELIDQIDTDLPLADPVTKIGEARLRSRTLVDLGDQLVGHYVQAARAEGASWSQIGDALGVTKQAAQQRRADAQFERFTGRARAVIVLAQDRARALKHDRLEPEHLLLGLVSEGEGLAAMVIKMLAGSLDPVSDALRAALKPGEAKAASGNLPMTEATKHSLSEAADVAVELGHNYIGTEHLLLGLLRVPETAAARILTEAGVTYDRARDSVVAMLVGYQHRSKR
jgi:hypothetical protein